ncbi:MAG: ABC transporter ATP-binding protein [Candidatus Riflebacteria bacterium]|nr:ABC transporter ATP-binding protein [Candidatus Riflebacteria bacterium]
MTEPGNSAISISSLSFSFPDGRKALNDISLTIKRGEKVALIGPNGAGKSTLIHHLNGLLPNKLLEMSTVSIFDIPVSEKNLFEIRRKVGILFQHPDDQLFCPTVFEDVAFGPRQFEISTPELSELVSKHLSAVGLINFENRSTEKLSQGEKRRVCLAGILICSPDILAFDEPTSDLDPRGKRQLRELLGSISKTQLIASHDLDWLLGICNRAILLNEGRILADGKIEDILANHDLMVNNGLEIPYSLR